MMDETRTRFLTAIASQLEVARVAEVHLFPAIRQGGMESGVAVLALDLATQSLPEPQLEPDAPPSDEEGSSPYASTEEASAVAEQLEEADEEAEADVADLDDGELLAEYDDRDGRAAPDEPPPRPAPRRFTVYSARYRHTLKGPDRGKWEVSVTEEADAPLLTVDAVVRGVQRRSGDVDEIVRLSGDEMRGVVG